MAMQGWLGPVHTGIRRAHRAQSLTDGLDACLMDRFPDGGTLRSPRAGLPYAGAALLLVLGGAASFALLRTAPPQGELPFPADRLRTQLPAPHVALTDHEGRPVSLDELRGRVVVLTGVYATCGFTCPMILGQAKRAVAALSPDERAEVTVLEARDWALAPVIDPTTGTASVQLGGSF